MKRHITSTYSRNEESEQNTKNHAALNYTATDLQIKKAQMTELEEVFRMYQSAKIELEQHGIFQWTENYPSRAIVQADITKDILYVLKQNNELLGAINISEEQEDAYQSIDWQFDAQKVLVIHRLVIEPKHQRHGYAKRLMDFAEAFAQENQYSSIRLDAYSQHKRVLTFYTKRAYVVRGQMYFPARKFPFYGMEKEIKLK